MDIKLRIKDARANAGITQKELADALGIAVTTLSGYETGRSDPKTEYLVPIAKICGTSVDFLLGISEETKTPPLTPSEDDARGEVTREAVVDFLVSSGFIRPGEDLSDRDLEFLSKIVEMIHLWFDNEP